MAEKKSQNTCFVANLPFGVTDDQLREVFGDVGPVKGVRVVTDRDTGKQKGFAFIEFFDPQTAESAVRNLNEHDLNGRKLKVNFAANDMDSKIRQGKESGEIPQRRPGAPPARATDRPGRPPVQREKGMLQPKTMGLEAARGAAYSMAAMTDAKPSPSGSGEQISSTLGALSIAELYEIMAQMKGLVQQNPPQARQILVQNPQLTKALFQAQIMLGMVKNAPQVQAPQLQPAHAPAPHYLQPSPPVHPQPAPHYQPPPGPQPPHAPPHQQSPPGQPTPAYQPAALHQQPYHQQPSPHHVPAAPQPPQAVPNGSYAPAYGMPQAPGAAQHGADPRQAQVPGWQPQPQQQAPPQQVQYSAPAQGQPYAAPQPDPMYQQQPPQQQMAPVQGQLPPQQQQQQQPAVDAAQQQALLQQVMQLTPEQIAGLPQDQQAQVLALQQHMRSQGQL